MKKFLVVATSFFFMAVIIVSIVSMKELDSKGIRYFTRVKGESIEILNNGEWKNFDIIGVNMSSSKPGYFPGEGGIEKDEYLRWFQYIEEMGANCIRVQELMNSEFYEAIYEFNENKEEPIFIIQEMNFNEVALKDGCDPQSKEMKDEFENTIDNVIDAVHGNPFNVGDLDIFNAYDTDVSKYVIAYTIGMEWPSRDIIYSEIMNENKVYNGEYFYTTENSSSFESYIAEMGDYAVKYEKERYGEQRLITFLGTDEYHTLGGSYLNGDEGVTLEYIEGDSIRSYVDLENIKSTNRLETGFFASYNIYSSLVDSVKYDNDSKSFFKKINSYHTIPVIISEFGVPSSRIVADFSIDLEAPFIDEKKQGTLLLKTYEEIQEAELAGAVIFEWQDSWARSTWNTKERVNLGRSAYWCDAQTYSQSFGIMGFEQGEEGSNNYPDDSIDEWTREDILGENKFSSISMKSDEKYLYFMIKMKESKDIIDNKILIGLDVTPKSGSSVTQVGEKFSREIDFIIQLDGISNSKVLVHEYYNTHSFLESEKELMRRPDIINVSSDMERFSEIMLYTMPRVYIENLQSFIEKESYETGKLLHGNTNPTSNDYNSIGDFYYGDNYVEVRIPWGLLNFMDPSTKQIHDDYYENFSIDSLLIKGIHVEMKVLNHSNELISQVDPKYYEWKTWKNPEYRERLKESYFVIKEALSSPRK